MTRIPRRTLVLAALLALVLTGALISALTLPHGDDTEVQTRLVLEMVANMNGLWRSVGFDAAPSGNAPTPHAGSGAGLLLALVVLAVWVARTRRAAAQQHSRSRRS